MGSQLNAELQKQLDDAGEALVHAVVQIRAAGQPTSTPTADESEQLAKSVLSRVTKRAGCSAHRTNILRNVATIVVEATPTFIRSLIEQPEVISAIPNQTAESPMIPPVRKRAPGPK